MAIARTIHDRADVPPPGDGHTGVGGAGGVRGAAGTLLLRTGAAAGAGGGVAGGVAAVPRILAVLGGAGGGDGGVPAGGVAGAADADATIGVSGLGAPGSRGRPGCGVFAIITSIPGRGLVSPRASEAGVECCRPSRQH